MSDGGTAAHFATMSAIVRLTAEERFMFLDHQYMGSAFGSWWFTFKKEGWNFRIVYDARDRRVALESGGTARSRKTAEWSELVAVSTAADGPRLSEIASLIRKARPE